MISMKKIDIEIKSSLCIQNTVSIYYKRDSENEYKRVRNHVIIFQSPRKCGAIVKKKCKLT